MQWEILLRGFNCENRIESIPQRGQPKILDTHDKRNNLQKIKKDPTLSASILVAEIFSEIGKKVHPQTIGRTLKESGYNGRVARERPYVNEERKD